MKVFLTGATGYVGAAVADELQRAGHEVTGLARSEASARQLDGKGIRVVRGDLHAPDGLREAARQADAVVHAALSRGEDIPRADTDAVDALLEALDGSQKPFIYTSGVWVYGDTQGDVADEEREPHPPVIARWRPAVERRVLDAARRGVRSAVIRPGLVYGRGGGVVGWLLRSAREAGGVRYVGTGRNCWAVVHAADLAALYVVVLERGQPGILLNAVAEPPVRVRELAHAISAAAGCKGRVEAWPPEEARKALGPRAEAFALDQRVTARRARQLFGWQGDGPSVFEELERGSYAGMDPPVAAGGTA